MPRKRKPARIVEPFHTGRANTPAAPTVPTGLPYGDRQQSQADQRAIPLPSPGAAVSAPPSAAPPPSAAAPGAPADIEAALRDTVPPTPLTAPTARPGEPVTAGLNTSLPIGAVAPAPTGPDPHALLNALYEIAPNADIADLIDHFDG